MIFSRSPPPASTDWVTARWQHGLWWRRRRILLAASSRKSCWLSRTSAGENSVWLNSSRRRLTAFSTCGAALAALMVGSWHHYYNQNWQSGVNVLAQAKAFMDVPLPQGTDEFGNLQLPLLNPVRDATAYGDYRDHGFLADMDCTRRPRRAVCGANLHSAS